MTSWMDFHDTARVLAGRHQMGSPAGSAGDGSGEQMQQGDATPTAPAEDRKPPRGLPLPHVASSA